MQRWGTWIEGLTALSVWPEQGTVTSILMSERSLSVAMRLTAQSGQDPPESVQRKPEVLGVLP